MTESEAAPLAVPEARRASRRRTGAILAAGALAPAGVLAAACGPAPHPVRMEGTMAFSHKEKNDATWTFLSYLSRPEVAVEYAVGHGYQIPARTSARKGKTFSEQIAAEPALKAPVEGLESPGARPMPLVRGWVQIKGLVAKMLGEAQDGQRSARTILDDYTRQFQVLAGQ